MNPRAAINDLLPFQGSPFSRLGTSPQAPKSTGYVRPVECIERRGWDSNPRALADKRFSRPPRYDHFDTSPYFNFFQLKIAVCISDFVILSKSPILVNRFFKIFSKLYFVNSFATSFLFFSMPISVTLHQTILRMF